MVMYSSQRQITANTTRSQTRAGIDVGHFGKFDFRHSGESRNPVKSTNWMPDQVRHDEFLDVPLIESIHVPRWEEGSVAARKPYLGLVVSGLISGALYLALFLFHHEILAAFTRTDGWYPALPVITALLFSFSHGAFTGYFWEVLGITARRRD
ncbi:MAG: hypothetical protein HYU75_00875 [Betaproteobacteria bacterium]|nr:hypothetical protein [Betaproteobacteria bacterium]